jgi:WD40 repeat protein
VKSSIFLTVLFLFLFQTIVAQKLSIQTGHSSGITDLVFTPDGKFLASSGEDSKIILWDMASSKQMLVFSGHTKAVNDLAIHPSRNIIASAGDDNSVRLWEYPTGKLLKSYYFFDNPVKSVAFSPDGRELACGSEKIYLVDIQTHNYSVIGKFSKKGYNAIEYSHDGKYLAFGGQKSNRIYLYDTESKSITKKGSVHANDILFDENDKQIYIAGRSGNLKRIPVGSSFLKRKFNIAANQAWHSFYSIALTDKYFIAANKDNFIYVYNRKTGARKEILNAHTDEVYALAVGENGRFLASAGKDRKIYIWDLKKMALVKSMEGGANRVNSISFTENGNLMFIGYNDGSFRIWNLDQKGKVFYQPSNDLTLLERYFRYKYAIDQTNDQINSEKIMIKASLNQKEKYSDDYKVKEALIIWQFREDLKKHTLKNRKSTDYQSFLLKDTTQIFLFDSKGTHSQKYSLLDRKRIREDEQIFRTNVYSYDISNIKKDKKLKPEASNCKKLFKIKGDLYFKAINTKGTKLLALLKAKNGKTECQLWDLENKELIKSEVFEEIYADGGFSPIGSYIYLSSAEREVVKLFDAEDFTVVATYKGNSPVNFSPDDKLISYIDGNRNLFLANIEGKKQIFETETGHSSIISDLKFNMPYKYIATASHDGLIKFWDYKTGELLVSLAAFDENDFIYITAENYYYSTKGAMNYIGFIEKDRLYTFEQFDVKFNRPDIVFSKLPYSSKDEIVAYKKAHEKRVQKMGFGNVDLTGKLEIPVVKILNLDEFPISTTEREISVKINASDSVQAIDRINIWVNDVPVFGLKGYSVRDKLLKDFTQSFPVRLSSGRNKIQVSANNTKGFESLKETFSIICDVEEAKPDLYTIAIGVSEYYNDIYNLQYAAKDANDISSLFEKDEKLFANIHSIKVLNKDATVENILKVKDKLKNTKVDDVVVLFFAGHGVLDAEMNYYLATTEIDVNNMANTALRYDYLEGLFDGIPARKKVIIIDACHSGEVDKEENLQKQSLRLKTMLSFVM